MIEGPMCFTTTDSTIYYWSDTCKTNVASAREAGLETNRDACEQAQIKIPLPEQRISLVEQEPPSHKKIRPSLLGRIDSVLNLR